MGSPATALAVGTVDSVEGPARRSPHLAVASLVLAAPGWLTWAFNGHRGVASAWATSAVLALNVVATRLFPSFKVRVVRVIQRSVVNPTVRVLLAVRVLPLGIALLETTGRRSGRARRNPVGEGRTGDTFWIVAEHGHQANYVRNIKADPHVRIRTRAGLWPRWYEGIATVVADDDPHARQRQLCRRRPLRAVNAAIVRAMGTDLVTVRVDLAPRD